LAATVELLGYAKASACKAAQAAVLLLDGLLQHLRPKLRQRGLNVAASQATSGRGALQQRFLTSLDLSLKASALLDLSNGRALRLWASQPSNGLLLLECLRTGLLEWL
jgi:hypothetical protein